MGNPFCQLRLLRRRPHKDISEYSLGRVFEDDLITWLERPMKKQLRHSHAELSKVQVKNVNIKVNLEEEKRNGHLFTPILQKTYIQCS